MKVNESRFKTWPYNVNIDLFQACNHRVTSFASNPDEW